MKKELRPIIVGKKKFSSTIDVTDPCYDKDVWCRLNDVKIKPGEYTCVAWMDDDEGRCFICGIYLDENIHPEKAYSYRIGSIGVDAGLAGFFENKPDYSDVEWAEFCSKTFKKDPKTGLEPDAWIFDEGFFTVSGYGDGGYNVYKICSNRQTIGYEIRF